MALIGVGAGVDVGFGVGVGVGVGDLSVISRRWLPQHCDTALSLYRGHHGMVAATFVIALPRLPW